jgi:P-type E1-E2 ATPase
VGSLAKLEETGQEALANEARERLSAWPQADQSTLVVLLVDGALSGLFALQDRLRPAVPSLFGQLAKKRYTVRVFSGDRQAVVHQTLSSLSFSGEALGDMKPQDKLLAVEALSSKEAVVMVGDGLNDMGALAKAQVGIAMGHAAPSALKFSDIVFHGDRLHQLGDLLRLAEKTQWTMNVNYAISLTYNALSFILALTGMIGPLLAAILMPLSSLSVVGITAMMLGGKRFKWASSMS